MLLIVFLISWKLVYLERSDNYFFTFFAFFFFLFFLSLLSPRPIGFGVMR